MLRRYTTFRLNLGLSLLCGSVSFLVSFAIKAACPNQWFDMVLSLAEQSYSQPHHDISKESFHASSPLKY